MKPNLIMRYLFLALVPFLLFSCQKDESFKKKLKSIVGDYDWIKSYPAPSTTNVGGIGVNNGPAYVLEPQMIPDAYGMRILKNRKVTFYKNGELIEKGEMSHITDEDYYDNPGSYFFLISMDNGEKRYLYKNASNELVCDDFPFDEYTNHLKLK